MNKLILSLLAAGVGFAAAVLWVNQRQAAQYGRELAAQRAAWEAEKAALQAAGQQSRAPLVVPAAANPLPVAVVPSADPQEILERLAMLKISAGQPRSARPVISLLEKLAAVGPEALPAIKRFFASGRDVAYETANGRGARDISGLAAGLVPVSLRFGLFDVVRQIGGEEAEAILGEALSQTGRGIEVAYLANLLEELSPGKYRDAAVAAVKNLLPQTAAGLERDYLFSVLRRFGDDSYVATAQAQLVQPDGKVDRSALKYVQQTLGEKSIALAAQTLKDTRVVDADSREALARVALNYVGANDEALTLFHDAALDPQLKPDQRRNLIEDLNQDGLSNRKAPTPEDLKIIANRYLLTQTYLQQDYIQNDKMLSAAFREADKDLANMLNRAAASNPAK